jgi:hypothetical protein
VYTSKSRSWLPCGASSEEVQGAWTWAPGAAVPPHRYLSLSLPRPAPPRPRPKRATRCVAQLLVLLLLLLLLTVWCGWTGQMREENESLRKRIADLERRLSRPVAAPAAAQLEGVVDPSLLSTADRTRSPP